MLDVLSIIMIIVYLTLLVIPLIYNNKTARRGQISNDKQNHIGRQDNASKHLGKSIIILLNNVSDEQLSRIIKLTNINNRDRG